LYLSCVDGAAGPRAGAPRRRARLGYLVPAAITLSWLAGVTTFGLWPRVLDNWVAAVTMVFGSFIGASTPQSSGAVAYPVFTKVLGISSEVARTFALCIQIVGLGTASLLIWIRRRTVDRLSLLVITPTALVTFLICVTLLSDRSQPFWPSILPGAYVKVGFSLLVMTMATIVYLGSRVPLREVRDSLSPTRPRQIALLVLAGVIGGFATSQVGSGADVLFYLVAVVLLGLEPRVAVPTSLPIMVIISLAGFLHLGIGQGMLLTRVEDGFVVGLGTHTLPSGAYAATSFDLLGLWLAAVPVACWMGPLGSAFAAAISTRTLALFVGVLATLEIVTTVLFLEQLRTDRRLQVFAVAGAIGLLVLLWLCQRYRHVIAGTTFDRHRSLSREAVDALPDYGAVFDNARESQPDGQGPEGESREADR
jgi:uncharacterized membrane protein YfcA